ncbi:hypothetical protein [Burkholderia sp. BE12]|uniref:hypothetical protein n=1 Tax=Burkholderia sp. BE12 TaxID=2082394 RepID=UPI00131A281F|nr:hypothetical protein [Burkholderia sp. BE12]
MNDKGLASSNRSAIQGRDADASCRDVLDAPGIDQKKVITQRLDSSRGGRRIEIAEAHHG